MSYTRESFLEEAKNRIIDFLNDGYDGYLCDMHNEVFNMEHYTEDYEKAVRILDEIGGYSAVAEIINYQKDNFGEVTGDFDNPVWVLSMYWYIIGEEALAELMEGIQLADDLWDEEINEEESTLLANMFEAKMGYDIIK